MTEKNKGKMSTNNMVDLLVNIKKKFEINKIVDYCLDDFIEENIIGDYKYYKLNKSCIIFNQLFNYQPLYSLEIKLYNGFELSKYINQINKNIYWLGGQCKNELIEYYNNEIKSIGKKVDDEWYETLDIYNITITIEKNKKLYANICCGDNIFKMYEIEIKTDENKIYTISVDIHS
jgi:hypothetical protein